MKTITVAADVNSLDEVIAFIETNLDNCGCQLKTQMELQLAVEEIFVNIANYSYGKDGGEATVSILANHGADGSGSVEICFTDSGVPYNPLEKADPDTTLSLEEREIGGLGVFLVKKIADSLSYEYSGGKNVLTIRKIF